MAGTYVAEELAAGEWVSDEGDAAAAVSAVGAAEDVSTIVHTAMALEKAKRYPTAEAFSEDIRRYLAKEVILARPPSALYQLQCFARRNMLASVAMCSSIALLLGGGGLSTYLFLKEQKASDAKGIALEKADIATKEAAKQANFAERGLEFYGNLIARQATTLSGQRATLSDQLRGASLEIPDVFKDAPALQVQFLHSFATAHYNESRFEQALKDAETAVELVESDQWTNARIACDTHVLHGLILGDLKRHTEALVAVQKAIGAISNPTTRKGLISYAQSCERLAIAQVNLGNYEASLSALQPAFDTLQEGAHLPGSPARLMITRAVALAGLDRHAEAIGASREAIASIEDVGLANTPQWVDAKYLLGEYLAHQGQHVAALTELGPLSAVERSLNGEGNRLVKVLRQMAECHRASGDHAKVVEALEEALRSQGAGGSSSPHQLYDMLGKVGKAYRGLGDQPRRTPRSSRPWTMSRMAKAARSTYAASTCTASSDRWTVAGVKRSVPSNAREGH